MWSSSFLEAPKSPGGDWRFKLTLKGWRTEVWCCDSNRKWICLGRKSFFSHLTGSWSSLLRVHPSLEHAFPSSIFFRTDTLEKALMHSLGICHDLLGDVNKCLFVLIGHRWQSEVTSYPSLACWACELLRVTFRSMSDARVPVSPQNEQLACGFWCLLVFMK